MRCIPFCRLGVILVVLTLTTVGCAGPVAYLSVEGARAEGGRLVVGVRTATEVTTVRQGEHLEGERLYLLWYELDPVHKAAELKEAKAVAVLPAGFPAEPQGSTVVGVDMGGRSAEPQTPSRLTAVGFSALSEADGKYLCFKPAGLPNPAWEGEWVISDQTGGILHRLDSIKPATFGSSGIKYNWNAHSGQVVYYNRSSPVTPAPVTVKVWTYGDRPSLSEYIVSPSDAFEIVKSQYRLKGADLHNRIGSPSGR